MGRFIRLATREIFPREFPFPVGNQKELYAGWLIDSYLKGEGDAIVPPAVKPYAEHYIVVDGHFRLMVADLFTQNSRVYIPKHKLDGFTKNMIPGVSDFTINDLNHTIEDLFDVADRENYLPQNTSLTSLRQRPEVWFLKDIYSAKKFYDGWQIRIQELRRKRAERGH